MAQIATISSARAGRISISVLHESIAHPMLRSDIAMAFAASFKRLLRKTYLGIARLTFYGKCRRSSGSAA
jgi:hypothetical protein